MLVSIRNTYVVLILLTISPNFRRFRPFLYLTTPS